MSHKEPIAILATIGRYILTFLILNASSSFADYQEPTTRTNINKQSDLFERSVEDMKAFSGQVEAGKEGAVNSLQGDLPLEVLTGKPKNQVDGVVNDLSSIKASDLENRGRAEMVKSGVINQIYVDEESPLFQQAKKDAHAIANASGALIGKLTEKLKDIGIDCKTVKGNKEVEPEYYLEIKKEPAKDTIYNQKICQELRNQYVCKDILKLKCENFSEQAANAKIINITADGYGRNNGIGDTSVSTSIGGRFIRNAAVKWEQAGLYTNITASVGNVMYFGAAQNGPYWAAVLDMHIHLELLEDPKSLHSLSIEPLIFSSNTMLSVNGKLVLNYPMGGDRLEPTGELQLMGSRGEAFERINLGGGRSFVLWWDQDGNGRHGSRGNYPPKNIDLKPFVKQGSNVIHVRQVGHVFNLLDIRMKMSSLACQRAQEEWEEICTLK